MPLDVEHPIISDAENYLRTKISLADWQSKSGTEILTEIRESGFKISNENFAIIRRDVLDLVAHQEQIAKLKPSTPIPLAYMTNVPTWELSDKYNYRVGYDYVAPKTGLLTTSFVSISTDEQLSTEDVFSSLGLEIGEVFTDSDGKKYKILNVRLTTVYNQTTY